MQPIQGCTSVYPRCTLSSGWTFNPSAELQLSLVSAVARPRHLSNRLKTLCGGAGSTAHGPGTSPSRLLPIQIILYRYRHRLVLAGDGQGQHEKNDSTRGVRKLAEMG